ncbi:hypothetical protein ACFQPF_17890 [Fictibacillus iocasae]|uniref:Uncharacterized protein n=1 Tax=Fictibacillus iocasae TaxID=2715437 RepID=A0ABW2NT26_9BACL
MGLLNERDSVLFKMTVYLPFPLFLIGWLFYYSSKNKLVEYAKDIDIHLAQIFTDLLNGSEIIVWLTMAYFAIMYITRSRLMLFYSPVIFVLLLFLQTIFPNFLLFCTIYGSFDSFFTFIGGSALTLAPAVFIVLYHINSHMFFVYSSLVTGLIVFIMPLILRDDLAVQLPGYKPYVSLLAATVIFYFVGPIAVLLLNEYRTVRSKVNRNEFIDDSEINELRNN